MKIAVTFLVSDIDRLATIKKIDSSTADYIHVDIKDGKFVANNNFTLNELNKCFRTTKKPLDVHLMVNKPLKYLKTLALLNTEYFTFHCEIKENINTLIDEVRNVGLKPGLAINPQTDVKQVLNYLPNIDMVLILGVTPGFGGQPFQPEMLEKVKVLNKIREEQGLSFVISFDGGINDETIDQCRDLGIDIFAVGSYICRSDDYNQSIANLKS